MTLQEIKITSYLMGIFSNEDESYKKIAFKNFNLNQKEDCLLLLKFLNQWGCRQFKIDYHDQASKNFQKWYKKSLPLLPNSSLSLINQSNKKIKLYYQIFNALKDSFASMDKRGFDKTVGPVGAAKVLFALRKNMFPPWDNPIIKKLDFPADGEGYVNYLLLVKEKLMILEENCKKQKLKINELPIFLKRPYVSLVKLMDEYFWLTITRKCYPEKIIKLIEN